MTGFSGYSDTALPLLTAIAGHDREWFAAHHDEYVSDILDPTKQLVTDLGHQLHAQLSPDLQAVPRVNGSIAPINNDLRFRSGPPYRDHLLLRFWEGDDRLAAPTLLLRVAPHGIGFGCAVSLSGDARHRYRSAVAAGSGERLADCLAAAMARHGAELCGQELRRVPAGFAADHPRADLLRHTWFQLRWTEPVPRSITSARFAPWCVRRLLDLADVHRWLRHHV